MGRILAFDYGIKRTGIAESDDSKVFAFGLTTVATGEIDLFLKKYLEKHQVDIFLVGDPSGPHQERSETARRTDEFSLKLSKKYPHIQVIRADERFTSKMAFQTMIDGGVKKMGRRDKKMIDKISATILLQSYLETLHK